MGYSPWGCKESDMTDMYEHSFGREEGRYLEKELTRQRAQSVQSPEGGLCLKEHPRDP